MNAYIAHLSTLHDSPFVVASTKKWNIPFNNATLAGIMLATCHTKCKNLYKMNHNTVLESTRSMLHDLKNIKKVFVEKSNKKARANKAKAGTTPQKGRQFWRTSPQEGTHRQVLQVVQGGGWVL